MARIANVLVLLAVLLIAAIPVHADEYVWDQTNDVMDPLPEPMSSHNVIMFSPVGQEFVPNLEYLDVVQLWLSDRNHGTAGPANFIVNIRQGTIGGPIIGTSETTTLPGGHHGVATFVFETVPLVPQSLYVMELVQLTSSNWMVSGLSGWSTYPLGRRILVGVPYENADLWFREGIGGAVPVRAVTWGEVKHKFL